MTEDATPARPVPHLVLVTGPSGAGRSTAIRALEDIGFESIDNMPLSLIPRLMDGDPDGPPLALGVDTRNRDFSTAAALDLIAMLTGSGLEVLYLDCRPEVLERRYSETRRRHPLAPAETPAVGIAREFDLLVGLKNRADVLIDTSDNTVHETKAEVQRWFGGGPDAQTLAVSIHSFSYKRGLPRGLDMVFDVRFLRNPYWSADLRAENGRNPAVSAYISEDPTYLPFFERVADLIEMLLPAYQREGKAHVSIGFGCTGGQHRSVAISEALMNRLAEQGWQVSIRHRELERRTGQPSLRSASGMSG